MEPPEEEMLELWPEVQAAVGLVERQHENGGEWNIHMGVSINGGTPKWMVYEGKSN